MSEKLGPIVADIEVARNADEVWRVMTDEASAPRWLGCMRYQKRIGAVFYMQQDRERAQRDDIGGATHCEILALDAPRHFQFSWFFPGFPATQVSFRLEQVSEQRTRVLLQHDGWEQFDAAQIKAIRDMLDGGWRSFVLPNLKQAAES